MLTTSSVSNAAHPAFTASTSPTVSPAPTITSLLVYSWSVSCCACCNYRVVPHWGKPLSCSMSRRPTAAKITRATSSASAVSATSAAINLDLYTLSQLTSFLQTHNAFPETELPTERTAKRLMLLQIAKTTAAQQQDEADSQPTPAQPRTPRASITAAAASTEGEEQKSQQTWDSAHPGLASPRRRKTTSNEALSGGNSDASNVKQHIRESLANQQQPAKTQKRLATSSAPAHSSATDQPQHAEQSQVTAPSSWQLQKARSMTEWFLALPGRFDNLQLRDMSAAYTPWTLDTDPVTDSRPLVSRHEALLNVVQRMFTRWLTRRRKGESKKAIDTRSDDPIHATHASPGSGKSRFLDEVAVLIKSRDRLLEFMQQVQMDYVSPTVTPNGPEQVQQRSDDNNTTRDELYTVFVDWVVDTVPLTVTYIGATEYYELLDAKPEAGLFLRVMVSYFYQPFSDGAGTLWTDIAQCFVQEQADVVGDLSTAINVMRYHRGDPSLRVLLLIDELAQCGDDTNATTLKAAMITLLRAIGKALLGFGVQFYSLVTSLDQDAIMKCTHQSKRAIKYTQLKPINGLELFEQIVQPRTLWDHPVIRRLITDCNGHPLLLQKLYEFLSNQLWYATMPWHDPATCKQMYQDMLQDFTSLLSTSTTHRLKLVPTMQIVVPALLCCEVEYNDTAWGHDSRTYSDLVAEGQYIYSASDQDRYMIPTLSVIALYRFAKDTRRPNDAREQQVRNLLKLIILTDFNFNDEQFELFHARWEALRRTLLSYYDDKSTEKSGQDSIVNYYTPILHSVPAKKNDRDPTGTFVLSSTTTTKQMATQWRTGQPLESNVVMQPAKNNPGFDLAIPVCSSSAANSPADQLHLIEMKYSRPDLNRYVTLKEITDKHKLAIERIGNAMPGDKVYLVFACYRPLHKDLEQSANQLPANVLLLDRRGLNRLYGPTLASRQHFATPLSASAAN